MTKTRSLWTLGLAAVLLVIIVPLAIFWPEACPGERHPLG